MRLRFPFRFWADLSLSKRQFRSCLTSWWVLKSPLSWLRRIVLLPTSRYSCPMFLYDIITITSAFEEKIKGSEIVSVK